MEVEESGGVQGGSDEVKALLEAKQWGPPPVVKGTQEFGPGPEENAPVGKPVTKHTAHLQVLSAHLFLLSSLLLPSPKRCRVRGLGWKSEGCWMSFLRFISFFSCLCKLAILCGGTANPKTRKP